MNLLFVGDIASPDAACTEAFGRALAAAPCFQAGHAAIGNLEGMIAEVGTGTSTPVLFNHPSIAGVLRDHGFPAVSLANNHTLDLPARLPATCDALREHGIGACGAGDSKASADEPARFEAGGREVLVLAWCWEILLQHQRNPSEGCHVNRLRPTAMRATVRRLRAAHPQACIVLKVHWSFDLETRPFPLYRILARQLIDAGADAVIGCHSHCVQGGERYKDGLIVYGLGNFFIPWHTFIRGTIHFPDFAREELAVSFDPATRNARCHWFRYSHNGGRHDLVCEGDEDFDDGPRIREASPYRGMDDAAYLPWFKTHRRKSKALPVYRHPDERLRNGVINGYLRARIRFARFLARTGLREWNN